MRIIEAAQFAGLRDSGFALRYLEETRTADEMAEEIWSEAAERGVRGHIGGCDTQQSWRRKYLPSKNFTLMRMPLNAAALPCDPKGQNLVLKKIHAREEKPIIVDYNKHQVGQSINGYVPELIVIDGKHRFKAAALRGDTHIMAWVGEIAVETLHSVGSGGGGPAPERTTPAPGSSLVAKKKVKATSRQEVKVENRGTYAGGYGLTVDNPARRPPMMADGATPPTKPTKLGTLNVKKNVQRILSEYNRERTMGLVSAAIEMQAKAPPGCENMVKGLKDADVDNPYAVAWWHHNKYGGCGSGKGK
jgi:hypothetical protein